MLSRRESVGRIVLVLSVLLLLDGMHAPARADAGIRIALFKTATDSAELQPLAAAIDPVLQAALGEVPELQVATRPALDLPSLQLAIDCVGDTVDCLSQAVQQSQAQGLVAPTLRKLGQEIVLTMLFYDGRGHAPMRAVTRRYPGARGADPVLDDLPGMVRELFGMAQPAAAPAASPEPVRSDPLPPSAAGPEEPPAARRRVPVLPIVVAAVGVGLLAAGTGFAVAYHSADKTYAGTKVTNLASAAAADKAYSSSRSRAMLADIGFGVGAAALITGTLLFIVQAQGAAPDSEHAQARTRFAATPTGVFISSTWD
jgi:hypothetical protein